MEEDSLKKIQQINEAIKTYSLNIRMVEGVLLEMRVYLCDIQNQIADSNLITLEEVQKLKKQGNIFRLYVNEKRSSLLEFENKLKLAQEKLKNLQQ